MDQSPQQSGGSDLQGGKVVWNFDVDDSKLTAALQSDSKAVSDFSKSLDSSTSAASGSFDNLSKSAQNTLQGLRTSLANGIGGKDLQDDLSMVALDNTGAVSNQIKSLSANLLVASENHSQLLNSAEATDAEYVKSAVNVANYKDKLSEAIDSELNATQSTTQMGQSFGSMVTSMAAGTLAAIGISDAFNTVKSSIMGTISSAADLEQTKTTFTSLLGSAQAADTVLQQLSYLSTKSSFDLPTLQAGAQQLLNFGVSAQNVVPTLISLGDIASMVGTQKLPQLTYAYAQVAEQGDLTTRQLTQFTRAGVPLLDELAKQSGITTQQLQKDMSSGAKPSFDQVQQALANMTSEGGKFFDGMQKQSQTFNGTATDIANEAGKIGRAFLGITEGGDIQKGGIFDTLKNGLTDFMSFLSSNATTIVNIFQGVFSVVGMIGQTAFAPISMALQFLGQNIVIVATVLGALLAGFAAVQGIQLFITGINLAIDAVDAFDAASLIATLTNPWLALGAVIAAVFGAVLFDTFSRVQNAMAATSNSTKTLADNLQGIQPIADQTSSGLDKVGQKLQDINDKIADQESKFQQSLAQAVKAHQDKAAQLQKDINTENEAYADSVEKKKEALDQQNANEAKAHEDHLVSLQRQLDQELTTGHNANSLKAMDLQAAIAKENDDYAQKNATNLQTYQTDVANAKEAHDQKINDLTTQLKTETDLLQKHAADVASVQNVMIQDDIDKLKQSNTEQLKALDQQKQQTLASVASTNSGVIQQYNALSKQLQSTPVFGDTGKQMGAQMGTAFSNALKDALSQSLTDVGKGFYDFFNGVYKGVTNFVGKGAVDILSFTNPSLVAAFKHNASGGHVSAGQPSWVGDNPDGSLNSTSELFVPDVSGTIVPSSGAKGTGSRGNRPINVTYNSYSTTDDTRFLRDLAWQMGNT